MLDRVLNKYCSSQEQRSVVWKAWQKMIDKGHLLFLDQLEAKDRDMLEKAKVSYYIPWILHLKKVFQHPSGLYLMLVVLLQLASHWMIALQKVIQI